MKKVLALAATALMLTAMFAGCAPKAPSGDDGAAIKIGMCGPLIGGNAQYGLAVKAGMEIAVEELNAKGGLQLAFQSEDDESDAEKGVTSYNRLKDWGMHVFGGAVTTDPSLAISTEAVADQIFMLTPSASAEDVAKAGNNIFQICFTDPNQGAGSADLISQRKLGEKIAVIYDSSTAYSTGIYESFMAEAKAVGLDVVCETSFTDANKSDLSTQVTQCKESGADLVFMPFYYTEAAQVLTYADRIGYEPTFFGCDGMDGIMSVKGFDVSLAEGLIMMTPFAADADDEATKSFVAKYKEKMNGETPNQFAADGYDVVYAIYQACAAANLDGSMAPADICAKLIEQFTSMQFDGLTGSGMTWDSTGMVSKIPTAVVVQDGAYVSM